MTHYFDNTAQRQQFSAALKAERARLYRRAGTAIKKIRPDEQRSPLTDKQPINRAEEAHPNAIPGKTLPPSLGMAFFMPLRLMSPASP